MDEFFPHGVWFYVVGGLLIGVGIALVYLLTGRIAGLSSFFTAVHSWWDRRPFFQQAQHLVERRWKSALVAGLVLGAVLHTALLGDLFVTQVQWPRLLLGGILVGLGTRTARGCTSGHGICGNASLAPPSLVTTLTFMLVAILTANIVSRMGVTP